MPLYVGGNGQKDLYKQNLIEIENENEDIQDKVLYMRKWKYWNSNVTV